MRIKKIIGLLHLWLGLMSGLVVFILAVTGGIYCFEKELRSWLYADKMLVSQKKGETPLSLDSLRIIAQSQLGNDKPINRIEVKPDGLHSYKFIAFKNVKEAVNYSEQYPYYHKVYINPYNGHVLDVENTKWEFLQVVLFLHYNLLLGKIGHQIIGWATVIFLLMLITGLVLWWPKNKHSLKKKFLFKWKNSTQWKRKNYDLHSILGFYSLLFAVIIALTGIYFAFEGIRPTVKWIANGGQKPMAEEPVLSDTLAGQKHNGLLEKVLRTAKKEIPEAKTFLFILPEQENKKGVINVTGYLNRDNYVKRSLIAFDRSSGEVLKNKPHENLSSADRLHNMIYDIHVGSILGLPGKFVAFFASLVVASLPVTGFLVWHGRRKKRKLYDHTEENIKFNLR